MSLSGQSPAYPSTPSQGTPTSRSHFVLILVVPSTRDTRLLGFITPGTFLLHFYLSFKYLCFQYI